MTEFFLMLTFQYAAPFAVFVILLAVIQRPLLVRISVATVTAFAFYFVLASGGTRWIWTKIHIEDDSHQL